MIKLAIMGGFLGAGKTTLILNLAKRYRELGLKVGIVTNDQGSDLVDTEFLKSEGFSVMEVEGGCFCCNFDVFTEKVDELAKVNFPDIILAEPVGSCTDLIATIFKPLINNDVFLESYVKTFSYSPLSIVVDPKRVKRVMMEEENNLFPNEINYLFDKQLQEASLILLNKIDLLSEDDRQNIISYLKKKYCGTEVIPISAKEKTGLDYLANLLIDEDMVKLNTLDIDYTVYGAAEAYLGWLNAACYVKLEKAIDVSQMMIDIIENCQKQFKLAKSEIAHLKLYAIAQEDYLKVSLVSVDEYPDFNKKMEKDQSEFNLIINARVNAAPAYLEKTIKDVVSEVKEAYHATLQDFKVECFAPSQPNPKYRMK
ncbi:MAG: cobalamin synthesis protein [Clostridia bacterium]|jgi:Ni2+-binding GTPase involved in maturation of urease and hydrogenase|nr:cobalamin synthesis protein [Clostridia bacterium]